ncbi:MAG TPA: VCBS repeat-containing protein, partial [Acidobacteriaceae bacterium]
MLSAVCAAQVQQFLKVPEVQPTEGQVRSFVTGQFQQPPNQTDILYVNAPAVGGTKSTIVAGALLYSQGFSHIGQNQIAFQDVTSVVATPGDFNGDGLADFAFALTPTSASGPQLCVYYGSGATVLQGASGMSAYNGGNAYPPVGQNGCLSIAIPGNPPNLDYITTIPGRPGFPPELAFEDTANNYLFVYANTGVAGTGGVLTGFTQMPTVLLPAVDGSGPIYTGDLNGDGVADFVINGQTGHSASVYLGKADGTFQFSHRYVFDKNVHSMLLQDMDGDNRLDIVVEGDNGVIEIFKGNGDGTFATTSEGGTAAGVDGYSGQGGHLAAINPISHDILVTMPIGLSVLQGNGTLSYALKTIYNIGPGRASYALADFFGTNNLDFAVDSPEGIAIIPGNPDGTFQSSNAYASLSPALGAVVGKFRNAANNPAGNLDVAVATSADYAQLLTGHGDGTFSPATTPTGYPGANSPWSTIFAGDFNGDTKLDLAYSWRGLPVPAANPASSGIAVQYGNGDGTFGVANYSFNQSLASVDYLNGESAVGDFNGDNIDDLANLDPLYDTTLLGSASGVNGGSFNIGLQAQDNKNVVFNQVATGFFKTGRTNKQDLVFQEGANFVPYVNSGDGKNFAQKTALTGAAPPLYPSAVLLNDV